MRVLKHAQLDAFLQQVYSDKETSKAFLQDEVLPYCLRKPGAPTLKSLEKLSELNVSEYEVLWPGHHLWRNIGYPNESYAPSNLVKWINDNAERTVKKHAVAFKECGLELSDDQISLLSRLIALDYLSDAVRGKFYLNKGSDISYYRELAVNTLK